MIIDTIAPISIDNLKKFFEDKTITFQIDYANSLLKGEKLLVYLGNLDIPCDINLNGTHEENLQLLESYLRTGSLVNLESLENMAFECLLESKGILEDNHYQEFIQNNLEIVNLWKSRLDSMILYNMYIVKSDELSNWAKGFQEETSDSTVGINFVNLLKYQEFYSFYQTVDVNNLKFYKNLFDEYCFKGHSIFNYWCNENNPMFLMTWAVSTGNLDSEKYKELFNVEK